MRKIILLTFFSVFTTLTYGQCPDPPSVDTEQFFCSETAWLLIGETADNLGDLQIFPDVVGWTLTWYEDNAGVPGPVIANPDSELLVSGTVYHVTQTDTANCESAPLEITVAERDCACIKDPTFEDQDGNSRARGYEFVQFDGIANHKTCGQTMQGATPLAIGTTNGVGPNDDAVFVTPGNDPPYVNTGGAPIGTLPLVRTNANNPASSHAFRLNKGHEYQTVITAMQKEFIAGEVFVFNFALALQDPGHPVVSQPFAQVRLYDQNDNIVQQRCLISDASDCIFSLQSQGNVLYSDWSCMKLNTFDFIGQPLRAEIIVSFCEFTQHFTYVYIDDIFVGNDSEDVCGNSSFGYALIEEIRPAGQNCFIPELSDQTIGCGTSTSSNVPGFPLEVCGLYDPPISQGAPPTLDEITMNILQNDVIVGTVTNPAAGSDPNSFCFTINETDINVLPYGDFSFELEVDFELDCGDPYNFFVDDRTSANLCPRASCPMPITVCDTGDTGFSNFDLTEAEDEILGANWQAGDIIFSYYEIEEDAHNEINPIADPTNYDNTVPGGQTIYIRLDWNIPQLTNDCYYLAELELQINKLPDLDDLDSEVVGCGNDFEVTLIGTPSNLSELGDVTYQWFRGTTQIPTTGSFYDATETGQYTVIVSNFDCEVSHTFTVTNVDFEVDLGQDVVFCDQSTFTINPDIIEGPSQAPIDPNDATYLWSTGETTQSITVSNTGTYTLEVTYEGCTVTDQINVAIGDLQIDLGDDINQCDLSEGYELVVDIIGVPQNEVTYLWSTGETTPTITVFDFGVYTVDVDWNGCVETDSVEILQPEAPEFTLGENITKCSNDQVTIQIQFIDTVDGDLTYTWYLDGGELNETGNSIQVTEFGEYRAVVDNEGCTSEATVMVEPYQSNPGCIITEGISPEGSPGLNDNFDLGFLASRTGIDNLQIFNRQGVLVYEFQNYTDQWVGQTNDNEALPTGVYFYVIDLSGDDPVFGTQITGNIYINRGMN